MRLNFLCEGQTEEAFVNRNLRPHLLTFGITTVAQCIPQKKSSNSRACKGGWLSYAAVKKALLNWMAAEHGEGVWFTTMLDLYAIPDDFPRMAEARKIAAPHERVAFRRMFSARKWRVIPCGVSHPIFSFMNSKR